MKKLLKIFSTIVLFYILVKITDVSKNLIVASILGVSLEADVYLGILNIPDILLILIGFDSIKGVLNSEFSSLKANESLDALWLSFSKLFMIFSILGLVFLGIFVLVKTTIVEALLPGFSGTKQVLAVNAFLIITPVFFLKIIYSLSQAVSNAFHKYYVPIIAPAIINFAIVGSLFIHPIHNSLVYNLAYGITIGNFLVICVMMYFNMRLGAKFFTLNIKPDSITLKVLKGISIMVIMVIVNQLYFVSRNFYASFMADGSVSVLNYATMIPNLFSVSIFTVFFNVLLSETSTLIANYKLNEAKELFFNITFSIFYFILPIVATLLICRNNVLELIFLRGNFSRDNINLLLYPYFWEVLALIPYVIFISFVSLYLAAKKYALLSKIGVPIFIFGIFLNYFLSKWLGLYGISLSYFIISVIYAFLLFYFSKGIWGVTNNYIYQMIKMIMAGIISGFLVFFFHNYFSINYTENLSFRILYTMLIFLIIFGLYYLLTHYFNVNYYRKIIALLKSRELV